MQKSKELLETIAKALVDHPEEIKVDSRTDDMGVLLTLYTLKEDRGQVIGREGKTAQAIRMILRIAGIKENARVNLKIADPEGDMSNERLRKTAEELG